LSRHLEEGGIPTREKCDSIKANTLSDLAATGYYVVEMHSNSDAQLLREYAEHGTEAAFTEVVTRNTNLVYSAALRQVNSPDIAAEVAQCVFVGLAQGARSLAGRLAEDASLAGWLCRSARNVSLNLRRDEFRRHSREREAMEDLNPISETAPDWERLRPVLDDAMSKLIESDYDALVIRFFRNQDFRSVGLALGVSADTARKRVSRALDKLREHLSRRGITTTDAALSMVLAANAVQAAPLGLASAISSAAALAQTALPGSTAIAITTITKNIAMTTIQKALIATTLAASVGTGIYETRRASSLQEQAQTLLLQQGSLTSQNQQLQEERDDAATRLAAAQHGGGQPRRDLSELLKLRAEVTKLRGDSQELAQLKATINSDPTESIAKSWMTRVKQLDQRLGQMPGQTIPELQFLTGQDWLNAVKDSKQLESDADFAQALGALRDSARSEFAAMVQGALRSYAQANGGQPPTDLSQLQPYFPSPVDDSVLQRYQLAQSGVVTEIPTPLGDQDDHYYQIGADDIGSTSGSVAENTLQPALQAFAAANNGQKPTDPSQLLPYVTTPAQQAVIQKMIQNGHP
jgi:RNA polymerase sigma factor (sigma-70 family)